MLPASLNDDAGAEDESHEEDGVPQLLQILLQTHRPEQHDVIIRFPHPGQNATQNMATSLCSRSTCTGELVSPVQMTPCHSP